MQQTPSTGRRSKRGFTLIELMIVVAIAAILAAVAYPSYQSHVRKTRRALAASCLQELAQHMERRYTTTMRYDGSAALPPRPCVTDLAGEYVFEFATDQPTATTYALEATPTGHQAKDRDCGTLGLNNQGIKSRTGHADVKSCWP